MARPLFESLFARNGFHSLDSAFGRSRLAELERAVSARREAYVLGIGAGSHNAGAALAKVSRHGTVELICNEEEERYTAIKHCAAFPEHSIENVKSRMRAMGLEAKDLAACVIGWNYPAALEFCVVRPALEEAPASLSLSRRRQPENVLGDRAALREAPTRLGQQLGLDERMPIIGIRHHDAHAYFSYAVSPFAEGNSDAVMVIVADGSGDDATTSLYRSRDGKLELLRAMGTSLMDSLGATYGVLSSTQGGWPPLSSEGRYMGAAAWGDGSRLTNRHYRRLKQLFHLGPEGEVHLNRVLANWTRASWEEPYDEELRDILGEPVQPEDMWHPDAVLNLEDVRHPELTRDRVDRASAVQMVFEDAMIHVVEYLIRATGSSRLVLSGGAALNCVANMRLLECFDERWYERNLGQRNTRLHLWVPPVPGDAGAPIGAAYAFAMRAGARPGEPLRHAFHCGHPPTGEAIAASVSAEPTALSMSLGDCSEAETMARVADLLAFVVADDGIMGIYQGCSETGPRALGHRSIVANPCKADIRGLLNERVKYRELVRPLAPMLTRAAAERYFHLQEGACAEDYDAYNYMVLTAQARPEAHARIPAVIHRDGSGRLQIVRPEIDPFCHEFLLAMGRRVGVEASVNTSLNVGAPIAHTPAQAIATLKRARGMEGLLMIDADRRATLVWLADREEPHRHLLESLRAWSGETGFALPDFS
jgi:carbamoyltransferase